MAEESVDKVEVLKQYGLDERAAKTAASSAKIYAATLKAYEIAGLKDGDASKASMAYTVVTKLPALVPDSHREYIYSAIGAGRIESNAQVEAAMEYMVTLKSGSDGLKTNANMQVKEVFAEVNDVDFNEFCGVGRTVTDEEINGVVDEVLNMRLEEIKEKRYQFKTGPLLKTAREKLRFVDGKILLGKFDERLAQVLGPKTEADLAPPKKKKEKKPAAEKPKKAAAAVEVDSDPLDAIPSVLEARELESAKNSPELVAKQKAATNGKIVCRFPPEPNGYLHVGHAKAMFLDFGYAKKNGGECILRFDDTNPESEDQEYIDAIIEMVKWMGHDPARITYSSDYFEELYELACELIRRGKAYICHQNGDETSSYREQKKNSPWRDRPIDESLKIFADMRKGKLAEGEATLRMKIDMQNPNPVMRDPIAYRIRFTPHPKAGDKWCIYPSYDFTHCLVDSLEWVTHSLCTLEFEIRRDSYYWLLEALDLYRPFVWEFARLVVEGTIVSKRKLLRLVKDGHVRGWDDPRMPTLVGLRRRGYPPEAIQKFCASIGVSRADNIIGLHALEYSVRSVLDATVTRAKCVLNPLKVTILNLEDATEEELTIPNHPQKEDLGSHKQMFTRNVYIDRGDFRMTDEKGYYGLAPGKTAMLRHAYPIAVKEVKTNDSGEPVELMCEYDKEKSSKPKGVLHWVSAAPHSRETEIRMYNRLFKSEEVPSDWEADLNPDSEVIITTALVESFAANAKPGDRFQFERVGYFVCDKESSESKTVFNQIVSLKDTYAGGKK